MGKSAHLSGRCQTVCGISVSRELGPRHIIQQKQYKGRRGPTGGGHTYLSVDQSNMRAPVYLASALFACSTVASNAVDAFKRVDRVLESRNAAKQHAQAPTTNRLQKRASPFLNNATQKFAVDGTKIPDVDFDVGESYAGLVPISSDVNEERKLFFWFFPSSNPAATDEILIW